MKLKSNNIEGIVSYISLFRLLFLSCFSLVSTFGISQTLPAPAVTDGYSCGAGHVILSAGTYVDYDNLQFDWYVNNTEGSLELIGSVSGTGGVSEFITPFIIHSTTFFVGIRLGSNVSELSEVRAIVSNTAYILESPKIQLCEKLTLNATSSFDPANDLEYVWEKLVAQSEDEASYAEIGSVEDSLFEIHESGFYRVRVLDRDNNCLAVSGDVEVVEYEVAQAIVDGPDQICFLVNNDATHFAQLSSEYGRSITEYKWEESVDGIVYSEIGDEKEVFIYKPEDLKDDGMTFYRLTIVEGGCEKVSAIDTIHWKLMPYGTISHIDPSISQNDFFYCWDESESTRTLRATSQDSVSISWIRGILINDLPLSYIKDELRYLNPYDTTYSHYFESFETIGYGEEIVLGSGDGGLMFAFFTDTITGCSNYSSNAIFADTAIPYIYSNNASASQMTSVCAGSEVINLSSYDRTPDTYQWFFSIDGINYQLIGEGPDFTATPQLDNQPEKYEGWYKLGVTKNGCYDESEPVHVQVDIPVTAVITADNLTLCVEGDQVTLSSQEDDPAYHYQWYHISNPDIVISKTTSISVSETGGYVLAVTNGRCVTYSNAVFVTKEPIAPTLLNIEVEGATLDLCIPRIVGAHSVEAEAQYQWYYSENSVEFSALADETDDELFINTQGYYFLRVANENGCYEDSNIIDASGLADASTILVGTAEICGNAGNVLLSPKNVIPGSNYVWYYSDSEFGSYEALTDLTNDHSYLATKEGFYYLEASTGMCSSSSEPIQVIRSESDNQDFEAKIVGNANYCLVELITLGSLYSNQSAQYQWHYSFHESDGFQPLIGEIKDSLIVYADRFRDAVYSDKGSVFFQLEISEGSCSSLSPPFQVEITRNPLIEIRNSVTNSTEDVFVCDLASSVVELEAFQLTTNLDLDYQWSRFNVEGGVFEEIDGADSKSFSPSQVGTYVCKANTPDLICESISQEIDFVSPPDKLVASSEYCASEPILLEVDRSGYPLDHLDQFSYQWYFGSAEESFLLMDLVDASVTISPASPYYGPGYYFYKSTGKGCELHSDTIYISESDNSFNIDILSVESQKKGLPFELHLSSSETEIIRYNWEPSEYILGDNSNKVVVSVPSNYSDSFIDISVTAFSSSGCSAQTTQRVDLTDLEQVVFSKFVTPNSDGINDYFQIAAADLGGDNSLIVLDSRGNKICEIENYDNGLRKSTELAEKLREGVYYYLFRQGGQVYKGNFLVRK